MRPFPMRKHMSEDEELFNYRLSRGRMNVKCTLGILRSKFRLFDRPIATDPSTTDRVIMTACGLHNFIRIKDRPHVSVKKILDDLKHRPKTCMSSIETNSMQNASAAEARQIRINLTNFFKSNERDLSLQNDICLHILKLKQKTSKLKLYINIIMNKRQSRNILVRTQPHHFQSYVVL